MSTSAKAVIAVATKEVGYHEGRSKSGSWNNDQKYSDEVPSLAWSDGQPWCCTFVSWVAMKAGAADLFPRTASCDAAAAWWKKQKRWSEYPAIGAQVLYGKASDLSHTGIVIAYDADTITTIEGNTNTNGSSQGDGVYKLTRRRRDAFVVGYGYPAYPEGIVSADPEWQRKPVPVASSNAVKVHGADISHHQGGTLDLAAAKKAGVGFLFHKATEGTTYSDPTYAKRRAEAAKAGIPFGAYHFARPKTGSAVAEARWFLKHAAVKPGDLAPMLDLEANDHKLTRSQLTAWVGNFAAEVKRQTGVLPILYTPFTLNKTHGLRLWVARYNNSNAAPKVPGPWKTWDIWQFSNGVYGVPNTVAGLGHVDLNTLRAGLTVADLQIPVPKAKPKAQTVLELTIATANVCELPRHDKTIAADFAAIGKTGVDLVMWQELGNAVYRKALKSTLPAMTHKIARKGDSYESPISFDPTLLTASAPASAVRFQDGRAKVMKDRFLTRLQLTVKAHPEAQFVARSGHFVARAWNPDGSSKPRKDKAEAAEQPARQKDWQAGRALVVAEITKDAQAGLPQILGTDQNRTKVSALPKTIAGYKVHAIAHGLDWLYLVDGRDYRWVVVGQKTALKTHSDHAVVLQHVRLVKRTKPKNPAK